jgi:hypothetical protein
MAVTAAILRRILIAGEYEKKRITAPGLQAGT